MTSKWRYRILRAHQPRLRLEPEDNDDATGTNPNVALGLECVLNGLYLTRGEQLAEQYSTNKSQ